MSPALRHPVLPRRQWVELHEREACPPLLREGVTETLRVLADVLGVGHGIAPVVEKMLASGGCDKIVDLCSGSGGPAIGLAHALAAAGRKVTVTLTDKYPNVGAFARARARSGGAVSGCETPVDATAVPEWLTGPRTLFNSFHHFAPDSARAILADACRQNQPIAIFEFSQRTLFHTLASFPMCVAACLASAPFHRPPSARRLLLTYALPAVPLVFAFDGVVSHMRSYSADEMEALTAGLDRGGYAWRTGRIPVLRPFLSVSFLLGMPGGSKSCA